MVPALRSQRGVGCTQVVKPPLVILYFFGPDLLDRLAEEIDVGFLAGIGGGAIAPGRAVCRGGLTVAMPMAL